MEGKVLGFFARHPGATQRDLAQHSGRDKAAVATLSIIRWRTTPSASPAEEDAVEINDGSNAQLSATGQARRTTCAVYKIGSC
jgi:hypothetical protein